MLNGAGCVRIRYTVVEVGSEPKCLTHGKKWWNELIHKIFNFLLAVLNLGDAWVPVCHNLNQQPNNLQNTKIPGTWYPLRYHPSDILSTQLHIKLFLPTVVQACTLTTKYRLGVREGRKWEKDHEQYYRLTHGWNQTHHLRYEGDRLLSYRYEL